MARRARRAWPIWRSSRRRSRSPSTATRIWYYLGGMTLFLFLVQVSTGILLLLYYRPSAEEAYESVQFLMAEVQFGWLDPLHPRMGRQPHDLHAVRPPVQRAAAQGLPAAARGDLVLRRRAHGPRPRASASPATCCPWNELAYFATKVGTEITGAVPGDRTVPRPAAAGRERGHGRHADALLRHPRRDPARRSPARSWACISISSRSTA